MIRPRKKCRPGRLKGPELEELRRKCWLRDGEACRRCGIHTYFYAPQWESNSYHMSHIKAKRMGGDTLDNVETLCGACHRKFHLWGPSGEKPCKSKS